MSMEIPFLRFQSVSLDQILSDPNPLTGGDKKSFVSGYFSAFNKRKWRNPFSRMKCCSTEAGIELKPKPKQSKISINVEKEARSKDTLIRKSSSGLCIQIDKLVFFKKYEEALELFEILEREGDFDLPASTYDALVNACIALKSIGGVKKVFKYAIDSGFEWNQNLRNRTLLMHVKCGMMIDARQLFNEMPDKNLVSWNTIIAGLVDFGDYSEAFHLFLDLWREFSDAGSRTFATVIRACAGLGYLFVARQLHSCALKMGISGNVFVSCALIDMYSKCGSIECAKFVFDDMPKKTTVGWNTIIAGYALHGYSEKALSMYYEMHESGVKMDHFTFSIVVRICARLASVDHAKQAHAGLIRHGFGLDVVANTTLVDFYSKWGRIEDARHVFDKMPRKNVISWNALIAGYGNHGRGAEAVEMFEQMLHEGMVPNHVTFLAVLSACSRSGLSDHGWEIFESMHRDYKIKPRGMHYACMIELLGQEGLLDEAFALIRDAPVKPTVNMWAALLTACRIHKNLELGKFAAVKIYGMEPEKLSNYVVLMNIYNSSGKFEEAAAVLETLKRRGLRMLPACSWIEIDKQPHVFLSTDKYHFQWKEIYQKLDNLLLEISKFGYVPEISDFFLCDVDEKEERTIHHHSEKLAIAFGLINTSDRTSLQVVQSHRICGDCHTAIKLIAMITRREIVVRDASRFHHFKDGTCSCGDYW
ncbi:pentatricopeptide repeat-containing protein At5g50390, chloroplastic-like isoform X2 [Malania oleifera]|uniref:pentatricopeptide repeat-containing protein At5g50390, chloroplastic-like isoform X2 n=1 Tax=Malania oleifera TaxID=397392 RepID=UPI0025ADF830|nr:pentatricopeptide repeat-containing protein At5g50390, chloroplastic-like isoform X2 [Malania oleifera]XP_057974613.1 pentatricopeptide repeat-containing protein At5g50390, chloroplastic-like isoform X2 [Malania oleifera]